MHPKKPSYAGASLTILITIFILLPLLTSCASAATSDERPAATRALATVAIPSATPFPEVLQTRVPIPPSPTPTKCPLDFVNALFQQPAGLSSFRLDLEQYQLLDDLTTRQGQVISSTQSLIFQEQLPVQGDYLLDSIEPDGGDLRLIVTDFEAYNRQADGEWRVLERDEGAELLRGTVDSPFLPVELREPLLSAGCTWERTALGTDSVVKLTFPMVPTPPLVPPATLTGGLLAEADSLSYTVWLGTIDTMYLPLQYELVVQAADSTLLVGRMQDTNIIFGISPPPGYPLPEETDG